MRTLGSQGGYALSAAVLAALLVFVEITSAATTNILMPQSDGTYTQWTPSTGSSHFALVDETPCNGTTDYNSTTVVGNRDSYGVSLASLPLGATITQIDVKPCASRAAAGGTNPVMNVFYRANGIDSADAGSYSLTGTTPVELATTTFGSLGITITSASSLEVGAVLTSSTKGARLSRIGSVLTYVTLNAPTNLSGVATTSNKIRLTWADASSNETGYALERSTDATNWTPIATTSANVSQYFDSGLSPSTTYYHRVRAFNSGAYTAYSNLATTTTTAAVPNAPSALTSTTTPGMGTTTDVILSWTDNSLDELGFKVERKIGAGGAFTQIATTTADVSTYTDSSLVFGTYVYRVRAYNSGGNSMYSNVATSTVP